MDEYEAPQRCRGQNDLGTDVSNYKVPNRDRKSTLGSQFGQATFVVDLHATKPEIKVAVETLFDRKVRAVNTLRQKGKVKRFRGRLGRRSDFKKAIVTFEDGGDIDVSQGV